MGPLGRGARRCASSFARSPLRPMRLKRASPALLAVRCASHTPNIVPMTATCDAAIGRALIVDDDRIFVSPPMRASGCSRTRRLPGARKFVRKAMTALLAAAVLAIALTAMVPTDAEARWRGARPVGWWPGPGVGLPPWGWRGVGWEDYYTYNPMYYGYGCYRPVLFWTPPPAGLSWQYHRVC
jgi:hypothetical protein